MRAVRLLSIALVSLLIGSAHTAGICASLDACYERIQKFAADSRKGPDGRQHSGLESDALVVTERAITFPGAVDFFIPLLTDPNDHLADLAAYALANATHIDPRHLPAILAALERNQGWLPRALCAVPGEAPAREVVRRFLTSEDAPENQYAVAIACSGPRVLPFIVEAARCVPSCPEQTHYFLGRALHEMEPALAASFAEPLLDTARNPDVTDDTADDLLYMIGRIGKPAAFLNFPLVELRDQRPALAHRIDSTLVELRSSRAGAIMARRLADSAGAPSSIRTTLRDIAELGADGREAGETILPLLKSDDWDVRLAAARALGYIDYQPAVSALIPALSDASDVRLNWVAAHSLGRLQNSSAAEALKRTSREHWYPPVRSAAANALRHIQNKRPYESNFHADNFPFEFVAFEHIGAGEDICTKVAGAPLPEARARALRATQDGIATLEYRVPGPPEGPNEKPSSISRRPALGLRVAGGWLTGADQGEWGGELMYIGDDGTHRMLADQNVQGIYRVGDRILALTGLAHLGSNRGMIFELRETADGWAAMNWRALPGAPHRSWLLMSGDLAVEVYSGGALRVTPQGDLRMACGQPVK